eukprot:2702509-Rhodomonas_salina.1
MKRRDRPKMYMRKSRKNEPGSAARAYGGERLNHSSSCKPRYPGHVPPLSRSRHTHNKQTNKRGNGAKENGEKTGERGKKRKKSGSTSKMRASLMVWTTMRRMPARRTTVIKDRSATISLCLTAAHVTFDRGARWL